MHHPFIAARTYVQLGFYQGCLLAWSHDTGLNERQQSQIATLLGTFQSLCHADAIAAVEHDESFADRLTAARTQFKKVYQGLFFLFSFLN